MVLDQTNGGRTGNQMFAIAFSTILAKELGYALGHHPAGYLPTDWFPNLVAWSDGKICAEPDIEVNDMVKDLKTAVACCLGHRVIVRGFFERAEFYIPYRDLLLNLYYQDLTGVPTHEVVFHVRGTDFLKEHKEAPTEYYRAAWDMLGKPDKIGVVTDDRDYAESVISPFGNKFEFFEFLGESPLDDFKLIRNAKNIVISRSTFSWWAAFLSDANVIQPTWKDGDPNPVRNLTNPNWKQIPC